MRAVSADFARNYLSKDDVATFWSELGRVVELPASMEYLYQDNVGLFVIETEQGFCGIHVAIPRWCRGRKAVEAGRAAIAQCLTKRPKVLARIERKNRPAQVYAAQCGMNRYSQDESHIYFEAVSCQ